MSNLATQVSKLIEEVHGGSVNAAATAIGIPQPTLKRIADGTTKNPTDDVLESIASFYGVSIAWLRAGKGAPKGGFPKAEFRRWYKLLHELDLPADLREQMLDLPFATSTAIRRFVRRDYQNDAGFDEAHRLEVLAWVEWLTAFVRAQGVHGVREALANHDNRYVLQLSGSPLAVHLYDKGAIDKKAMKEWAVSFLHYLEKEEKRP